MPPFLLPSYLPGGYPAPSATGTLGAIASVCASASALILSQYKDKPLLAGLLCSYLDRIQALDTATTTLYQIALSLDTAQGAHLDMLGRIVRESREGRGPAEYRRAIRVRVLVNRSQGRIEDLIAIASLFEDGAGVRVREYRPARVVVWMTAPAVNPPATLHVRLRRAKAAGVALQTVTHPAPAVAGRLFALGSGAASVSKTNLLTGLGWTGDTRGGRLAHVLG